MRKLLTILGIIAAIVATVLSVTPFSKIAFLPAIAALVFGGIAFYISRQKQHSIKTIQLVFLLTAISLGFATYKALFNKAEVGNIDTLQQKEKASEKEATDVLEELEIEPIDLEQESLEFDTLDDTF